MQVFVCVCIQRLVRLFTRRLDPPICNSQSSVTITGQRQRCSRAITEIAVDDLECPPQHWENNFLTKRQLLSSAGPCQPLGQTPFFCCTQLPWATRTGRACLSAFIERWESKCKSVRNVKKEKNVHLLMGWVGYENGYYGFSVFNRTICHTLS